MGLKYLLEGAAFVDARFPLLYNDERMNDGSLLLIDFSHSATGVDGVPAHNQIIPNIAAETAEKITGGGDAESLGVTFFNTFTSPHAAFERTSKGALHGVVSNTDQGGGRAYLLLGAELKSHIAANSSREYAVFIWVNVTRASAAASNYFDYLQFANIASASTNRLLLGAVSNTVGVQRSSKSDVGMIGTVNSNPDLNQGYPFAWGNIQAYDSLQPNVGRSVVLYSVHLVDVAASGKTFAELDAADAASFDRAFAEGGRFYGDTYSDPDLVLP
jgi:hypothetical protein